MGTKKAAGVDSVDGPKPCDGLAAITTGGGGAMTKGDMVALAAAAVGLLLLAFMIGSLRGEAKESRRNQIQALNRRLWALEQKNGQHAETK